MHKDQAIRILKGPHAETIRQWSEGGIVQMWSDVHGRWETLAYQDNITFFVYEKYRIKPEPVFKEVALFKSQGGYIYSALKEDVPLSWTRISDWVKVEIKDDVS